MLPNKNPYLVIKCPNFGQTDTYIGSAISTLIRIFLTNPTSYTVRNDLQDILEFVFSTINIVEYCSWLQLLWSKNYVYQATNILYHLPRFFCRTLQQNWVDSLKLSKNSKAG